ncbi:MAG: NAD-dependent epimerase/dehydratase family protein [Anaerolineae bacterium]|nr:NAD-dependent epimerase/dehydratase family protein [Anaerolineae bacterium]
MSLAGKSVLVTGGAGFIGSHLVDRIIQDAPANLVVVDNFFLGSESNLIEARRAFPALKVYRLDASDLAMMDQLVADEQIEVVFNLAVIPLPTSLLHPVWTINTNIGIALTFCEIARRGRIKTLVQCSSSEAYGTAMYIPMDEKHPLIPTTPYAASKSAGDEILLSYAETFGIDAVIVRPFNNFGPRQNWGSYAGIIPIVIQKIASGEPVEIYGDGEQTRDYIFVRDTVDAIVRVYEQESTRGKAINIATGCEISINKLVADILRNAGAADHPVIHAAERPGDVRRHCGDVGLAQQLIGFQPSPINDEKLRETIQWYVNHRHEA